MRIKLNISKAINLFLSKLIYELRHIGIFKAQSIKSVTILMYHKIDYIEDVTGICIRPDIFEKQIEFVSKNYNVISLDNAIARLYKGDIDKNYIVITFDDGYRDNYTYAYPVLSKYNVPATIFIAVIPMQTGTFYWDQLNNAILESQKHTLELDMYGIDKMPIRNREEKISAIIYLHSQLKKMNNAMQMSIFSEIIETHCQGATQSRIILNRDEIKEMVQSGLIGIGSHTVRHPILTRVSQGQAYTEIHDSKLKLEDSFGLEIKHFAYPNGDIDDFNEEIEDMVKRCGYKSACTTLPGTNAGKDMLFKLKRVDVTSNNSLNYFGSFSKSRFSALISGELIKIKKYLQNLRVIVTK